MLTAAAAAAAAERRVTRGVESAEGASFLLLGLEEGENCSRIVPQSYSAIVVFEGRGQMKSQVPP